MDYRIYIYIHGSACSGLLEQLLLYFFLSIEVEPPPAAGRLLLLLTPFWMVRRFLACQEQQITMIR